MSSADCRTQGVLPFPPDISIFWTNSAKLLVHMAQTIGIHKTNHCQQFNPSFSFEGLIFQKFPICLIPLSSEQYLKNIQAVYWIYFLFLKMTHTLPSYCIPSLLPIYSVVFTVLVLFILEKYKERHESRTAKPIKPTSDRCKHLDEI